MDKKLLPIIKLIQSLGFSVLFIDDCFFVAHEFLPADRDINFHTLSGIDITDIVINNTSVVIQDKTLQQKIKDLISQIDNLGSETQKFSSDKSWRWFFSVKNYK